MSLIKAKNWTIFTVNANGHLNPWQISFFVCLFMVKYSLRMYIRNCKKITQFRIYICKFQSHPSFPVSVHPCVSLSLYQFIPVSVYPCIPVSLYPCISASSPSACLVCRKVSTSRRSSHCSRRDITYSSHLFMGIFLFSFCREIFVKPLNL